MKTLRLKKRFNIIMCAMVALLAVFAFSASFGFYRAAAEDVSDYETVTVGDGQFNQKSSAILNSSPNWTGAPIGDFKEEVIAGVIDLSPSSVSKDKFLETTGLDKYPEYKDAKPVSPFGKTEKFPDTNTCVLLINTNNRTSAPRGTAYGFTSETINLQPNSFYMFSAYVKTGEFAQDKGAVIKISGFKKDIGFWNIDTSDIDVKTDELNGFRKYTIYVATASNSVSATVKLQVGDSYTYGNVGEDNYEDHVSPSEGYAFFDNVICTRLSANAYASNISIKSERTCIYDADLEEDGIVTVKDENGNAVKQRKVIANFENGLNGLKKDFKKENDKYVESGQAKYVGTYDAGVAFDEDNLEGIAQKPYTYKGNNEYVKEKNILVLSAEKPANVYVETPEILIEANKFYRLSVWTKTMNISGGNAALVVVGENNVPFENNELSPVAISDISGSTDMMARYGWTRQFFYLRGSYSKDCKVRLQCWLGYSSNATGTALFDDVILEEVTYDFYNNNRSGGSEVKFDSEPVTTVSNGRFFNAENYGDESPWKPVEWTEIGSTPDDAASGVILTNEKEYKKNLSKYFYVPNPVSQAYNVDINSATHPSMLLLASRTDGYFGYSSPDISITTASEYRISVTMYATEMTGSGVNLMLTVEDRVIASIKDIKTTNRVFETFDFYVQGDQPFSSGTGTDYTAKLNVSIGRNDKKASGSVYIAEVACTTLEEGAYDQKYEEFKTARRSSPSYDMYSFRSFNFSAYDNTDTNAIKKSNSWEVNAKASDATVGNDYIDGVFDPHNKDDNYDSADIPDRVTAAYDEIEGEKSDVVYTLKTFDTYAAAQLINPVRLESDAYYMVTVKMAVRIADDNLKGVGAGIKLIGDDTYADATYTDIQSTLNFKGELEFRSYRFYIQTADTTSTLFLRVSLGDDEHTSKHVSGELYIAGFTVENLGGSDDELEESDTLKIVDKHVSAEEQNDSDTDNSDNTNDTDTDTETDTDDNTTVNDTERWWLIPSILFGIAIVLAVVGTAVRAIIARASKKQRRHELSSYDRRFGTAEPDETTAFDDENDENRRVIEQDVESFNDDVPEKAETPEETKPEEPSEPSAPVKTKKTNEDINDFDD